LELVWMVMLIESELWMSKVKCYSETRYLIF